MEIREGSPWLATSLSRANWVTSSSTLGINFSSVGTTEVLSRNLPRASASIQAGLDYQSVQHRLPVRVIDPRRRQREGGYLLLAILLMMALMIIAATIEAPRMVPQMKRDREEEMIHRGTEYARATRSSTRSLAATPPAWSSSTTPTRSVSYASATRTRLPKTASGRYCTTAISK